ncbi:MAG: hypothetical protein R2710_26625 [Acidimicrobiales bacterium]
MAPEVWRAQSVVLAAGGFEANPCGAKSTSAMAGSGRSATRPTTPATCSRRPAIGAAKAGDWSTA